MIETLDGSAQTVEASAYISQLPWYTDPELESGRVDLNALAIRYRAFGGVYPEVQPTLYAEAKRFQDIAERLKNAGQQRAAETQKRVQEFLAAHYDPAGKSSRDDVANLVKEADELISLVPTRAAEIGQAAVPLREALAKLDAGQAFYDGKWRPTSEAEALRKERADAAEQQTFDKTLGMPLEPLALSGSQLALALGLPCSVLIVLLISGLLMLPRRRRRGLGVFLLAVAFAAGGIGYKLISQNQAGGLTIPSPDSPDTQAASARVVRFLYLASQKDSTPLPPESRDVRFTNSELTSFLVRHAQSKGGVDTTGGLRRDGLAVGVTTEGFIILERVAAAGQTAFLRYDVKLDATGTVPGIKEYSVKAGALPLPSPIRHWLWTRIGPALTGYIADRHILDTYALTDMARGEIRLAATRPVPALRAVPSDTPTPSPATAATPVPAAVLTPVPMPTPATFGSYRTIRGHRQRRKWESVYAAR